MNNLEFLQEIYGGKIYDDRCVIWKCPQGTYNASFPSESDNLFYYDTLQDLLDDINYLEIDN